VEADDVILFAFVFNDLSSTTPTAAARSWSPVCKGSARTRWRAAMAPGRATRSRACSALARGQINNTMAVVRHHFNLETEEARSCVIHLARAAAEEFAACEETLRARSALLPALVRGMRDWIEGSFHWHMRSLRYVR
jgi:hypothetical protein